jgi:hypothetical protein
MKKNKKTMEVYFKFDLPCHEIKMIGKYPLHTRYYLLGYLDYTLSNVEFLEGRVFFELRDDQGLIGSYMVLSDNWERLVEIKKDLVESN